MNKQIKLAKGQTLQTSLENEGVEAWIGEDAELLVTQIQKDGSIALLNHFHLEKNAKLTLVSFSSGGTNAQNEHVVEFNGEGAEADLKGLSLLKGKSRVSHKARVEHSTPRCTSRQIFKNILLDESRSDFESLVHVHKDAVKSDSKQLNKNLLLSSGAHADAKPELQIENDDVSCAHGATVGQIDERELFYLKSRGLSEDQAKSLLVYGFADEILQQIKDRTVRSQLEALVREGMRDALNAHA